MRNLTRKRTAGLAVVALVLVLLTAAFVTPPAHAVHTAGDSAINARFVVSNPPLFGYKLMQPSQSLDGIRCQLWRSRQPSTSSCPDSAALAGMYFPNLAQSPNTLYVPWQRCSATVRGWDGYNVEYRSNSRTLVIHCYVAEPWIWRQPVMGIAAAQQPQTLLVVPTESLTAGSVNILEDDRVEHWVGDQSTEFPVETAIIAQ